MYTEDFTTAANTAKTKVDFFTKNPLGYFLSSMLAGAYVGFGILLIFTIGGLLAGNPAAKIVMGLAFGIALSTVVMAGAELFTGNNLIMACGLFEKTTNFKKVCVLWIVCFLGNWLGSILLALFFYGAGLSSGATGDLIVATSATKMALPFVPLFLRALLCNFLVCLAIWCSIRCKSESGKLIMIFWCLFAFITTGFEHSIANMTLLTLSIFTAPTALGGYFYNILTVTLGNMVGGIVFLALPYAIIAKKKEV